MGLAAGGPRAKPPVSVLLPVRDAAVHLGACLRSLARQTLAGFEVVAVDDGSTDCSGELLEKWARGRPRFRVLHLPRTGLVGALNAGLRACTAPVVARMDADDISHPQRLELQNELLCSRKDLGLVSCLVRVFPRRGLGQGFRLYEAWLNGLDDHDAMAIQRWVESPVAHPSVMLRRELLEQHGGYRDRGWPEDYDLWLRLLESGVRFAKVRRPLLYWRDHSERLTRRNGRYAKGRFLACKAHFLLRGPLAEAQRIIIWGAGRTGRRIARLLLDGGAPICAFVDIDPAKIGRTARGLPIVSAEGLRGLLGLGTVVLAAVASRGARSLIRTELLSAGLVEGREFWCVA